MTCKEFEELSGAFVLGAVTAEEREAARAHLVQCMACARLYQELRSVVADRLALTMLNRKQLRTEHFDDLPGGAVQLTETGRRTHARRVPTPQA